MLICALLALSLILVACKSGDQQVSTVPAIVPSQVPDRLVVQTLPGAEVTLKFWTWEWVPHPSPPPEMPNLRGQEEVEIPGSVQTQRVDSTGIAEFDVSDIPSAVGAEIIVEKEGTDGIHFLSYLDPSQGVVFPVYQEDGELVLDRANMEFAPGRSAGEYHGPETMKADQEASLTILP